MTVLEDDATVVGTMTYGELAKTARTIAVGLIERDILPGDRVALMLPTGLEFFATFFGDALCRRGPGSDLSADATRPDRGLCASAGRDPAQCRCPHAHHGARRTTARVASEKDWSRH